MNAIGIEYGFCSPEDYQIESFEDFFSHYVCAKQIGILAHIEGLETVESKIISFFAFIGFPDPTYYGPLHTLTEALDEYGDAEDMFCYGDTERCVWDINLRLLARYVLSLVSLVKLYMNRTITEDRLWNLTEAMAGGQFQFTQGTGDLYTIRENGTNRVHILSSVKWIDTLTDTIN